MDFHKWRLANNIGYEPFKTGSISLNQLKAVVKAQGLELKFGDILLLRTGYTAAFNRISEEQVQIYASVVPPALSGVEQSEDVLESVCKGLLSLKSRDTLRRKARSVPKPSLQPESEKSR